MNHTLRSFATLSCGIAVFWILFAGSPALHGQPPAQQARPGAVSDWSHHHLLYPETKDAAVQARIQKDPRWSQNRVLRRPETWWPERRMLRRKSKGVERDWSESLGTLGFAPQLDASFSFSIGADAGHGTWSTTAQANGGFLVTAGTLTVTATDDGNNLGLYTVYPGGPNLTVSPNGGFDYDNLLYPAGIPVLSTAGGPLFINSSGFEINLWGNSPADNYSFYGSSAASGSSYPYQDTGTPFTLNMSAAPDPGGGQTFPAKFVFDVTAVPSCTNDYVAMGLPASGAAGGQANIVGLNNLYTDSAGTGYCTGTGPTVMFAYASGSGQVPAAVSLSTDGTQLAYVENLPPTAYFHILTLGKTGTNGASPTAAVAPGSAGGNNAVDKRVLLSPNGGTTTQSSTSSAFVDYLHNAAYVTTYSTAGSGSGYLYKIGNVFNGGSPAIAWSVAIDAVPSSPVYDSVSSKVFFTDSTGRIDYVIDTASPTVVYGTVVAAGATSVNAVSIDSTNQMVYATFNTNGTNALAVQVPTSMASSVSVPVGTGTATYTGPYGVDFNNAFYTGSGIPLMFVAGTGSTGTLPTLYGVGFTHGALNPASVSSTALATGTADSSPVLEFYNATLGQDFLFAGVTNNCIATIGGGSAGCAMSLNITSGFPAVTAATTALAAAGGPTGIIIDNDSSDAQAASVYYATKTGATLVKATQSGLN